ncbi:carbohydrate ABC transporter permease [Mesoaciditoga lauensis]|uniref:carbohydrate ABC transporter permease n=1 Tax=Mesoaciditoga lauensis TaxID=1495039 RepID=UPI0005647829|nr:sugar ABC transporter permease [Mesoaciditoga lauensis]
MTRRKLKDTVTGLMVIMPALITQVLFIYIPLIYALYVSFHQWNMIRPMKFVGMRNYVTLFTSPKFWNSLYVTFIYIIGTVPTSVILGLLLAMLLNLEWVKGKGLFRMMFYIPVITAMAVAAIVWSLLFEPSAGLMNYFLGFFGISSKEWLGDPHLAIVALIIVGTWKRIGYNMVLFLAGLQSIPRTYYEAAMLDGASTFAKFKNITLPLLSPTTLFVVIIQFIASFQVFVSVSVMTQGGPMESTDVITYFLYQNAFNYLKMGYASSIAIVMFIFMFFLTLLQFKVSKKRVHY